jgi:hypothetical protein
MPFDLPSGTKTTCVRRSGVCSATFNLVDAE